MSISKRMSVALDEVAKIAAYEWHEESKSCISPEEYEAEKQTIVTDWIDSGYEELDDISMYVDTAVRKRLDKMLT